MLCYREDSRLRCALLLDCLLFFGLLCCDGVVSYYHDLLLSKKKRNRTMACKGGWSDDFSRHSYLLLLPQQKKKKMSECSRGFFFLEIHSSHSSSHYHGLPAHGSSPLNSSDCLGEMEKIEEAEESPGKKKKNGGGFRNQHRLEV